MGRVLPVVLGIALAIYAVADCARTPSDQLPGRVPKALWIVLIILVPLVGPIAWIIASRVSQAEARGGAVPRTMWSSEDSRPLFSGRGSRTPRAAQAPDDDEDFLFALEAQLYRERKERERQEKERNEAAEKNSPRDRESPEDDEGDTPRGDSER